MGIILAILLFSAIIIIHELGHFLLAKANGIRVDEFSLGLGPTLFGKQFGETKFSVKLLPFGGACMMGEDDVEDISEGSFNSKSVWARMSVIVAGPLFNLILAWILCMIMIAWVGYRTPVVGGVIDGYSAQEQGLSEGDVITKLDGRKIHLSREISMYLMYSGQDPVQVEYQRYDESSASWTTGHTVIQPELKDGRYYLGVILRGYRSAAESPLQLLQYSAYEVRYWILTVIDSLKMIAGGKVSTNDIAGPVRIVTIIDQTVEENTQYGFVTVVMNLLNLMVMFSANLGVMNLLPFPALDGGRLVFLLWELVTRHPVSQRVEGAVNMAGMALLMTFMVFVIFNDLRIIL